MKPFSTISPGQAIEPGQGHAFEKDEERPQHNAVPPAPEKKPTAATWTSTPSMVGQRMLGGENVRVDTTRARVFDLTVEKDLESYNALLQRTDPAKGDVQVIKEELQFSEKTDNWKVFVQYRTYLFKQLKPIEEKQ